MNYDESLSPVSNFEKLFAHLPERSTNAESNGDFQDVLNGREVHRNSGPCKYGTYKAVSVFNASSSDRVAYFELIETTDGFLTELEEDQYYLDAQAEGSANSPVFNVVTGMGIDPESACRGLFNVLEGGLW